MKAQTSPYQTSRLRFYSYGLFIISFCLVMSLCYQLYS